MTAMRLPDEANGFECHDCNAVYPGDWFECPVSSDHVIGEVFIADSPLDIPSIPHAASPGTYVYDMGLIEALKVFQGCGRAPQ